MVINHRNEKGTPGQRLPARPPGHPSSQLCLNENTVVLYVIIDIFSRYVPGWMLAHGENAGLAEALHRDQRGRSRVYHRAAARW